MIPFRSSARLLLFIKFPPLLRATHSPIVNSSNWNYTTHTRLSILSISQRYFLLRNAGFSKQGLRYPDTVQIIIFQHPSLRPAAGETTVVLPNQTSFVSTPLIWIFSSFRLGYRVTSCIFPFFLVCCSNFHTKILFQSCSLIQHRPRMALRGI